MSSYILSADAASDVDGILEYTYDHFGEAQMIKYKNQLDSFLMRLAQRQPPYGTLSVHGYTVEYLRCQKHYVFGFTSKGQPLTIFAILHEKMDMKKRVKERLDL